MVQSSGSKKTVRNSDELKMIKAVRKHPKAFGELYNLYVEKVYRYLYSRVGSVRIRRPHRAKFLAAFESFDNFSEDDHFCSMAVHVSLAKKPWIIFAGEIFRYRDPSCY
jgi:RNA polymerase sigma-70 factor (ECF subfamily)